MQPHVRRRAVRAARATAAELGLDADVVTVVHDSDRVALRLSPCEVLARVAPSGQEAEAAFEVEVARRLADVGAPVGTLAPAGGARTHVRDGFVVSLWTYYAPQGTPVAPAAYADALTRHHAALRRIDPVGAPHVTERVTAALREVDDRELTPELPEVEREFLGRTLVALRAGVRAPAGREQLLHGEPHPGNVLGTRHGPLFVDLATCCRGPVEFDLAHAPEEVARHCPGVDHALLARCRALNWALFSAWRWRRDDGMPDRARHRVEGLARVRDVLG